MDKQLSTRSFVLPANGVITERGVFQPSSQNRNNRKLSDSDNDDDVSDIWIKFDSLDKNDQSRFLL